MRRDKEARLKKSKKSGRKSKIIAASIFLAFFVFVAGLLLWLTSSESLVALRSLSLREGSEVSDAFTYSAAGISADMAAGCNIPAYFRLQIMQVRSRGRLQVYVQQMHE